MMRHFGPEDREQITVESLSSEALTTSEIEGELLDRASVQSSVRRHLGLGTDPRRIGAAEQGVAEMMVDLYRSFATPLSEHTLFKWHTMLVGARLDVSDIGRYRTHGEPMQVVSGRVGKPTIHFEAPPSSRVPVEMKRFIQWFNRSAPDGAAPLPALTRAGLAHLYFVSIHPFEDGNGRIGRALSEKVLSQSLGQAALTSLATTILAKRKSYYQVIEATNKTNEVTPWLTWFAATTIEAQRRTLALVEFLIDKARLLDRLRDQLNTRQEKALLRILREGPEGWKGGLSASNYAAITAAKPATTTRDLADLVSKGALIRTGERRHARYYLSIAPKRVAPVVIDDSGHLA